MDTKTAYSLYQTFSQNIPTKNISVANKTLIIKASKIFTKEQQIAFGRLILEHKNYDEPENNNILELPYEGHDIEEAESLEFDLNKLPQKLQWILLKFVKMCEKE
mgnify:CR=1 FL=1